MSMRVMLQEGEYTIADDCRAIVANGKVMVFNLVGEVGEFCSKIAKGIRKSQLKIDDNQLVCLVDDDAERDELETALKMEAGDVLWQLSGLCKIMGWKLDDVAQENLDKLASRKERGVIDGNGDNR